jgi:hypothetical protein
MVGEKKKPEGTALMTVNQCGFQLISLITIVILRCTNTAQTVAGQSLPRNKVITSQQTKVRLDHTQKLTHSTVELTFPLVLPAVTVVA